MAILKVARMGNPVLRRVADPIPPEQIMSPAVQMMIQGGGGVLEEWGIQQDLDRIPMLEADSNDSSL